MKLKKTCLNQNSKSFKSWISNDKTSNMLHHGYIHCVQKLFLGMLFIQSYDWLWIFFSPNLNIKRRWGLEQGIND